MLYLQKTIISRWAGIFVMLRFYLFIKRHKHVIKFQRLLRLIIKLFCSRLKVKYFNLRIFFFALVCIQEFLGKNSWLSAIFRKQPVNSGNFQKKKMVIFWDLSGKLIIEKISGNKILTEMRKKHFTIGIFRKETAVKIGGLSARKKLVKLLRFS